MSGLAAVVVAVIEAVMVRGTGPSEPRTEMAAAAAACGVRGSPVTPASPTMLTKQRDKRVRGTHLAARRVRPAGTDTAAQFWCATSSPSCGHCAHLPSDGVGKRRSGTASTMIAARGNQPAKLIPAATSSDDGR
jgi:hypothetical protein